MSSLDRLAEITGSLETRHVFELAAVLHGAKAVARLVLEPLEVEGVQSHLRGRGLQVVEAPLRLAVESSTNLQDTWTSLVAADDPRAQWVVLYAGRSLAAVERGIELESNGSPQLGAHLGYPACCVATYEEKFTAGVDWVELLLDDWRAQHLVKGPPSYLANKLGYLFDGVSLLPDYFPCSLYCSGAIELARQFRHAALLEHLNLQILSAAEVLLRPLAFWRGTIFQLECSRSVEPNRVTFQSFKSFAWRDAGFADEKLLQGAKGFVMSEAGLSLLDDRGHVVDDTLDIDGALILFAGDES